MTRYTLFVGNRNFSSWSLRPYLALSAAGAAFDTVDIRLRQPETRPDILRHSPSGKVPLLKIEDGRDAVLVWDSLAICETVAERHPEAGLLPADFHARAVMRAYASEMHAGFPDVRDQLGMDFARSLPLPLLRETTQAQIARILGAWQDALDTYKGNFLFGKFSIADCMYAPVVTRFATYGVDVPETIRDYMDRILRLPAMQGWKKAAQAEVEAGVS